METKCLTCKFYQAIDHPQGDEPGGGMCVRFPPAYFGGDKTDPCAWSQPWVLSIDECGEWKAYRPAHPVKGRPVSNAGEIPARVRNVAYVERVETLEELAACGDFTEWRNVGDVTAAKTAIVLLKAGLLPAWVRRIEYGRLRKAIGVDLAEDMIHTIETLTASLEAAK